MGRRQPQHPPAPTAQAVAATRAVEESSGNKPRASSRGPTPTVLTTNYTGSSGTASISRKRNTNAIGGIEGVAGGTQKNLSVSIMNGSEDGADASPRFMLDSKRHAFFPSDAYLHESLRSSPRHNRRLIRFEDTERCFWELVFTRHDRLRHLLEDVCLSSGSRARQMARIHCATLVNDLVFVGLDVHENVLAFHRTERLTAFLEELEGRVGPNPSVTAVEEFVRNCRPDFSPYLCAPPQEKGDAEYVLLGERGSDRWLELRASVCADCYATHLTNGLAVDVTGLKYNSDIQELYARLEDLVPQCKSADVTLRLLFHDGADALAEVTVARGWNREEGRQEWVCVPRYAAGGTRVDPHIFDPGDTLCLPQLADLGMFLPTTEVVICTRNCLHSTLGKAASPTGTGSILAPRAHDDFPYAASSLEKSLGIPQGNPPGSISKPPKRTPSNKRVTAKPKKPGSTGENDGYGPDLAPLPPLTKVSSLFPSDCPQTSLDAFPFPEIEPGPVHFAGGGGGKTGKSKPTKRYTCCAPGCLQSATFKPADEPRSKNNMVCVRHARKGMSCIKGPLCDHPDCVHEEVSTVPRRATFGFPAERQRRCGKHKLAGMLYATELVKKRHASAQKRNGGTPGAKKKAPGLTTKSARARAASRHPYMDEDEDEDEDGGCTGQEEAEYEVAATEDDREDDFLPKPSKRRRNAPSPTAAASPKVASGADRKHDEPTNSAFPSGLAAAAAAAAAGCVALTMTEADEEREQQVDVGPPLTDDAQQQMQAQDHPQHHGYMYPSNHFQTLSQQGPPSINHLLDGGAPQSFSDLANHPSVSLAALGEQANEAFRFFMSKGSSGDMNFPVQPSPATAAAAAAIAAALPPHMLMPSAPMLQPLPPGAMPSYPPQLSSPSREAATTATESGADAQQDQAVRFDMLVEAAASGKGRAKDQKAGERPNVYLSSEQGMETQSQPTQLHSQYGTHLLNRQSAYSIQHQQPQETMQNQHQQHEGSPPSHDALGLTQSRALYQAPQQQQSQLQLLIQRAQQQQHAQQHGQQYHYHNDALNQQQQLEQYPSDQLQRQQQHLSHVQVDYGWGDLGSPSPGLCLGGMEEAFGRSPYGGTTPKAYQQLMHLVSLGGDYSNQTANTGSGGMGGELDMRSKYDHGLRSVWAGDVAVVIVLRSPQGSLSGLASLTKDVGFEPADEGIYFVKNVTTCDQSARNKGDRECFRRELHRLSDCLLPAPASNFQSAQSQLVSTVSGRTGTAKESQLSFYIDQHKQALGLGEDAYLSEQMETGMGRKRPARRLILTWDPSGGAEIDVEFSNRSDRLKVTEIDGNVVLRPLGPTGPWLENALTDFARQGLAFCAADLMALVLGAARIRRDAKLSSLGGKTAFPSKEGAQKEPDESLIREVEASYNLDGCLSPQFDLPLDVLEGPLTALVSDPSAAFYVVSNFLTIRVGAQGCPRFTPASFIHFCNCFLSNRDPFGTAFRVWCEVTSVPSVEFRPNQSGQADEPVSAPSQVRRAATSSTSTGQDCFLHLSDEAPGLILNWCFPRTTLELPAKSGTAKGVVLGWNDRGRDSRLTWEVQEPRLQTLLTSHARSLGFDPTTLAGLAGAAQDLTKGCGEKSGKFMETILEIGQKQPSRKYIGASSS